MLKEQLAAQLREAIIDGRLEPGQRVIEGTWAREFGVAQASVREAINILIAEGLLTKDSGHSARVTSYSEDDVTGLYQIRAVLEGLAAYLIAQQKVDVERLERELDGMESAIRARDVRKVLKHDLDFHLAMSELSGNPFLYESAKRVLVPLFAFVLLRVLKNGQGAEAWEADLPRHRRMVELIREGDPVIAEHYVRRSYQQFVRSAYAVWADVGVKQASGKRRRRGRE